MVFSSTTFLLAFLPLVAILSSTNTKSSYPSSLRSLSLLILTS